MGRKDETLHIFWVYVASSFALLLLASRISILARYAQARLRCSATISQFESDLQEAGDLRTEGFPWHVIVNYDWKGDMDFKNPSVI